MSASIGSASLVLTTNSKGMTDGAKKGAAEAKGALGNIGGGLGGSFGKLGGMLKMGVLAGAVAGAAGAVLILKGAVDTIGELAEQGNMAKSLGMSSEAFTGLAGAASQFGVDTNGLFEGLISLSSKAQEALKGGDLGATFRKLGIDAQQFATLNPGQQFEQLHAALQGVSDPAERTRILLATMGEEAGKKLAPLLNKSTEELKKLTGQFAVSSAEMQKIQKADAAMKQLTASIGAVWRKVVVALAPIIEFFSVKLVAAVEALEPVFNWVARAFTTHWSIIIDILGEVFSAIGEVISEVGKWVTELFGLENVSTTIEEVVTGVWRAIGIAGAYAWDTVKAGLGIVAIGVGYLVKGLAEVIDLFASVVGLAKKLPESMRPAGLNDFIKGVEEVRDGVRGTGDDIKAWGQGAVNGFGQSADRVRRWFDNRANRAAAPGEAPGAAPARAPEQKPLEYHPVAAALKDTKEAYTMEAKLRTEGLFKKDKEDKQLKALEKANELLRAIVEGVTGIRMPALEVR